MAREMVLQFAGFRLEPDNARLWHGTHALKLKPKAFTVLRYLAAHADQLVSKDELWQAVWPDVIVSDDVLTACVRDIRKALGDNARAPQFIETVHGRGYRFIGKVVSSQHSVVSSPPPPTQHSVLSPQHFVLVGREAELAQLHGWWKKALNGERQIVFVSGEPGIGKTTLVDAFLAEVGADRRACPLPGQPQGVAHTPDLWITRGHCIEHYGAGEGYMPVLEALGRLCREPGGGRLIEFLGQHAPTWLAQMPALLSATEREKLQREVAGATRERMLREMAEALEALTSERPLVLQLEDLHWSDVSTLELLSVLARRRETARLLVLGTYRPVEMLANGHPLRTVRQELQLHRQCEEQRLAFLTEEHVAEYLGHRFAVGAHGRAPLQRLARAIHQRTEGNPLFMINVVEYLAGQGGLEESTEKVQIGIPGDLRQMIEEQLHRLNSAERQMLEVASVAGAEFSAAAVAAGLGVAVDEVEEQCEDLVRREQFLRAREPVEWPDGTVAARYQFLHALYQEVLYERISAARRSSLHRQIGEQLETAYGTQAREIAAELAIHFERGRDYRRAIQYLQNAGENAVQRSAHQEAISLFTKGLELLKTLPDTPERTQQELTLQLALGSALAVTKGYASLEVERAWTRARELCQQVSETPQLFWVLVRLWQVSFIRAQLQTTRALAEQLFTLAQSGQDPARLLQAHVAMGVTLYLVGELIPAREYLEQSLTLYGAQKPRFQALFHLDDLGVASLSYAAEVLWSLGYPDQALKRSHQALALAQELSRPFSLAFALAVAANLHLVRREEEAAKELAEAMIALSREQGFPHWLAWGMVMRGGALAAQGKVEKGIAQMEQGLAAMQAMETEMERTNHLPKLAVAYAKVGRVEEGLSVLAEAVATVNKTGQRLLEGWLYWLKGELTLQSSVQRLASRVEEAEACFLKAIDIARKQQAKSLELRAATSLARLWQKQGKKKQARKLLADSYGWFIEGFDTKDLQEAKTFLDELA